MPFGMALQRVGITAEDLRNIQRMAEDRITDELRRLAAEEGAESSEGSDEDVSSSAEQATTEAQTTVPQQQQQQTVQPEQQHPEEQHQEVSQERQEQQQQQVPQMRIQRLILQPLPEQPRDTMTPPMPDQPQQLPFGRMVYGRSLAQPVRIPVPMMQAMEGGAAAPEESQRPHCE